MAKIEKKSHPPIRLGIVGAGGFARETLAVLGPEGCPDVTVVAIADRDREVAESTAHRFGAKPFVDVRSMMVESGVEAVMMSLPHDVYPEYVRLAAQHGLHLLKEKPLARSLDEALALVDAYANTDRVFMIATQRRFSRGFAAMKDHLASAGRPLLVRSHFLFNRPGDFGWRGQKGKAGFGAFGNAGYHNIDLLNWLFGPPLEVFALHSSGGRDKPVHPYDTDDTGLCVLHYRGGLMGYLACSWVTQPELLDVIVHGSAGTLTASAEGFRQLDLAGNTVEEQSGDPATVAAEMMRAKVAAFAAAIRAGKKNYPCSARENVITQAVIEAAYMSSRTGQPQHPARVFELHGRSIEEFSASASPREAGPAAGGEAPPQPPVKPSRGRSTRG